MRMFRVLIIIAAVSILALASAAIGASSPMTYQGRLLSSSGTPAADGVYAVMFSLWTDSVGGTMVWSESQNVTISGGDGLFSCLLGNIQPLGGGIIIHGGQDLYLQQSVSGTSLTPRLAVGTVPHAFVSSSLQSSLPGAGALHMSVTSDSTRMESSHQTASGLIDSYLHLTDDGVTQYSRVQAPGVSSSSSSEFVAADSTKKWLDMDDDGDGVPESEISQLLYPSTSSMAIKTKGTGAAHGRASATTTAELDSVYSVMAFDQDDDGNPESRLISVMQAAGALTRSESEFALLRHTATLQTTPGSSVVRCDADSDDDGLSESEGYLSVLPTTSAVAIKTKGTGADKDRVMSSSSSTEGSSSALHQCTYDDDNNGIPEQEVSSKIVPTRAQHAINTKGTGAQGGRSSSVVTGTTLDSAMIVATQDNNADAIAEVMMAIGISGGLSLSTMRYTDPAHTHPDALSQTELSAAGCSSLTAMDTDDDGDPNSSIESVVVPGSCSVAIKTKGTGADPNRVISQTNPDGSSLEATAGTKSIGLYVKEVSGECNLVMTDLSGGVLDTGIIIDGKLKRFGIGVSSPSNPLEHSSGAHLTNAGDWVSVSDENAKENFSPVDGEDLLERIGSLEITEWNYKVQSDEIRHIGPTAQDFKAAFGVGANDKTISSIDPSGVALAAIKQLKKENDELKSEMAELKKLVKELAKKN